MSLREDCRSQFKSGAVIRSIIILLFGVIVIYLIPSYSSPFIEDEIQYKKDRQIVYNTKGYHKAKVGNLRYKAEFLYRNSKETVAKTQFEYGFSIIGDIMSEQIFASECIEHFNAFWRIESRYAKVKSRDISVYGYYYSSRLNNDSLNWVLSIHQDRSMSRPIIGVNPELEEFKNEIMLQDI